MKTIRPALLALCLACASLFLATARAQDKALLLENDLQATVRSVESSPNQAEQLRRAQAILGPNRWLSSAQVKLLARSIADEDARLEFAVAAYPRTVDPENFYEVYDAFTKFSKAFRLHDRIHGLPARPGGGPAVTPEEMAEVLKTLRGESFDETRQKLARQILTARVRFNSSQVRDVLKVFAFDESRLAVAKAAYDFVVDPENYYLVAQAFAFSDSKDELARYIASRATPAPR